MNATVQLRELRYGRYSRRRNRRSVDRGTQSDTARHRGRDQLGTFLADGAVWAGCDLGRKGTTMDKRLNTYYGKLFSVGRHDQRLCQFLIATITFILLATPSLAAGGAPPALYNKTINLSWTYSGVGTRPDGKTGNFTVAVSQTIYISSAGREFARSKFQSARRTAGKDIGPGDTTGAQGFARADRFVGNQMIGVTVWASGARQMVVTFDPGYTSCSVSVRVGKEGGAGLRVKRSEGTYTISSLSTSGATCSIQNGNAFAGQ